MAACFPTYSGLRDSADNSAVQSLSATAFAKKKQYAQAENCYRRAPQLDPRNFTARSRLADMLKTKTGILTIFIRFWRTTRNLISQKINEAPDPIRLRQASQDFTAESVAAGQSRQDRTYRWAD